ncbi:MAG: hypothetical protein ABMA64_06245 [Myxococcota bacterium]
MTSLLFALWFWLAASTAWAFDVTFCVDLDVDYPYASEGGDFWLDNSVNKAARGFQWVLTSSNPVVWKTGTLSENDADAGCTTVTGLSLGSGYFLTISPTAVVQGNTITHADLNPYTFGPVRINGPGTINNTIPLSAGGQHLVAAAYAVHHHKLGATGKTITLHDCTLLCNYTSGDGRDIYYAAEADKYVIAHEIGHALMLQQTAIASAVCNCSSGCDGGDNLNRKWWAQAFKEGIAWWYAMITWNAKVGGDCEWWNTQNLDVDLDGITDYPANFSLPCWGDPDNSAPDFTDGEDWLNDVYNHNGCTGAATNHTTEYDIVHYGWGLYAYGSDSINNNANDLTAEEIMTLLLAAGPSTWDPDGTTPSTTDDPYQQWNTAAAGFGAYSRIYLAHLQQRAAVDH